MDKIKSVLVYPDLHLKHGPGGADAKALNAVLKYAKSKLWSEVVLLGDVADYGCISSFNAGVLRGLEPGALVKDNLVVNGFLDELQSAVKGAKVTIIEGNHDYRIEKYLDFHPELEGQLECVKAWRLKERKINWVPFWSEGTIYRIGKANFIHGLYTTKWHSEKHCREYGENTFYGHTHDVQCFSVQEIGEFPRVGQSLGCLCEKPQWKRGRPDRWQQAFGVFHFFPNGNFSYNVVRIFNGQFISPEGRIVCG